MQQFDAMEARPHQVKESLALLIRCLEAQQEEGARAVWLTPKARKDLKALPQLRWPAEREKPAAPEESVLPREVEAPPLRVRESAAPAGPAGEELAPEGSTPEEKLAWLRERAATWPPARQMESLRKTMVFAVGNPRADLMLVGEAPGAEEERQGEPFVGPAGETLTKILKAMGLRREDVYITNIVKFRPAKPDQGETNRQPTPQEMACCLPFVRAEIEVVRPKVIVALGSTASQGLLGGDTPVGKLRGRFADFQGVPVMVTYHPAYLLRNPALSEKRKVWEDMLLVMERLGLPISEKQRGFFK